LDYYQILKAKKILKEKLSSDKLPEPIRDEKWIQVLLGPSTLGSSVATPTHRGAGVHAQYRFWLQCPSPCTLVVVGLGHGSSSALRFFCLLGRFLRYIKFEFISSPLSFYNIYTQRLVKSSNTMIFI